MRHLGIAVHMKSVHGLLHDTVGIGDALMLAQMLHPRFDEERFEDTSLFGGVLEDAPGIGAVAPPLDARAWRWL